MKVKSKAEYRTRRHMRLRNKISGTAARPRMSVFVSNLHMYVQFIDDEAARTLAAVTSVAVGSGPARRCTVSMAKELGVKAADAAKTLGIEKVVFDRGGFPFRGRIKILAEAAREHGLQF